MLLGVHKVSGGLECVLKKIGRGYQTLVYLKLKEGGDPKIYVS